MEPDAPEEIAPRVRGIGGVFIRSTDPKALGAWYGKHLGIVQDEAPGMHVFRWKDSSGDEGSTTWALFPEDTDYFGDASNQAMINFRVDDLHAVLTLLRNEGVDVSTEIEEHEYGRFGWITDPEGNRIELWEPAPGQ